MRLPGDDLYVMESHSAALQVWSRHLAGSARCVHLDAHLDVGWLSRAAVRRVTGPADRADAGLVERDCFLHTREGHFDIASWLGVALAAGMVSELYWVVPDEVWFANPRRLQDLLTRQVSQLSVESFAALGRQEGSYRFTLTGTPVTVCRLSELPRLDSDRTLLDVDLDYFARYRRPGPDPPWSTPWTNPDAVVQVLRHRLPTPSLTTVSRSRHGGYLPRAVHSHLATLYEGASVAGGGDWWHTQDGYGEEYEDYTWACGLLHRRRPADALALAHRAVARSPQTAAFQYALALAADGARNQPLAREAAVACLASGVESSQVLNDVAGIFARSGDLQEAISLQDQALHLDWADSPIISANLMALCAQAEDWERAGQLASLTLDRQPFNVDALVTLATALHHHGNHADAAETWRRAAELAPDERAEAGYRRRAERLARRKGVAT